MAVSDLDNHYYKINIDKCYVDSYINVYFDIYASEKDRLLEKSRIEEINGFLKTAEETIESINTFIDSKQILSEEEWENYYSIDPVFKDNLDLQCELNYIIDNRDFLFYSRNDIHKDLIPSANLLKLGFNQTWVDKPINIITGGLTNCGFYNGEEINFALYYRALKRIIKSETIDLL